MTINKIRSSWLWLINISGSNPDDTRRRRLLNILLGGTFILSIVVVIITGIIFAVGKFGLNQSDTVLIIAIGLALLIFSILVYFINRFWSGSIASIIFLLFLVVAFTFSDSADQVANGRTLLVFAIPIVMASVLLQPSATFFFATASIVDVVLLALANNVPLNTPAIGEFYMLALISWLSARSLESALRELRIINAELDQRVADRTYDLSEALTREQAEASRRQAILQGIADGVIVLNNDGDVIMSNMATSRLLETPIEQIMQHNIQDILDSSMLSEEDREILMQTIGAADVTMAPMRIRWDKRTLSIKAAPVRDAQGRAIGNVAVLRDFTREAEVEEMKNTFVSMVSHELRTPLNAILGYSEMLRDAIYGAVNDKQANAADRILKNSRRLLDIVSDLLDKAQIEAGHLALHYEKFKTTDVAENMHSVMDQIAIDKGLELTSSIAPDMPDVLDSDPQRLQQILVNLVNNAIKFTEKGGINVRIYRVTPEHWAFDVTDTGPGIAIEDQKFIFDPFRQVEGTITRSHGGIGLGLSIVNRIIDLMKGRIFVQSALGQGTTFTVILPFETPHKKE